MGFLSTIYCGAVGCSNEAAVKVNSDLLCMSCAKHEIPASYQKTREELIAQYTQSKVVTDAIQWRKEVSAGGSSRVYEDTVHACLGRVVVMLGLYGSKPDAILGVIHGHGYPEVTLADVEAVRDSLLGK